MQLMFGEDNLRLAGLSQVALAEKVPRQRDLLPFLKLLLKTILLKKVGLFLYFDRQSIKNGKAQILQGINDVATNWQALTLPFAESGT